MIFAAMNNDASLSLLQEQKSNWLITETEKIGIFSINYLTANNTLGIFHAIIIDGKWQCSEENIDALKWRVDSDLKDTKLGESLPNLVRAIITHFNFYRKVAEIAANEENFHLSMIKIIWNGNSGILQLPDESQRSTNEIYNNFFKQAAQIEEEIDTTIDPMMIEPQDWLQRVSLQICLHDKNLYPVLNYAEKKTILINSNPMSQIRQELCNLLDSGKPNLSEVLLRHPYYSQLRSGIAYHVNRIRNELCIDIINNNLKIAAEFTVKQHKKNPPLPQQKPFKLGSHTEETCLSAASIIGNRNYQHDRYFTFSDIKLDESWQDRISELLMYAFENLVAEIYQKFPAESQEQAIGTTAVLTYIVDGKVYVACAGDSMAMMIGKSTNFLCWPHKSNVEISRALEQARVNTEGGAFIKNQQGIQKLNQALMVSRGIGDNCHAFGRGFSNIPSLTNYDMTEYAQEAFLILVSDGITDCLTLNEIQDICQDNSFDKLADVLCNAAFTKAKGRADNISAIVIALHNCPSSTLAAVFDGHGFASKGHLLSEFASAHMPRLFKELAENLAPTLMFAANNLFPKRASTYSDLSIFGHSIDKKQKLDKAVSNIDSEETIDTDTESESPSPFVCKKYIK